MYLLLRGVVGVAALRSRIALAVFAVFYTAFEVLIGLGTGILIEQVNGLPQPSGRPAHVWSRISPTAPSSASSS